MEDFALYLPMEMVPSRRVLVLRYKNRFEALVQSLVMRGVGLFYYYYLKKKIDLTLFTRIRALMDKILSCVGQCHLCISCHLAEEGMECAGRAYGQRRRW